MYKINKRVVFYLFLFVFMSFQHNVIFAQGDFAIPRIGLDIAPTESPQEVATSLQTLFILTIISLAPSILIMMTCFTRIIIVLYFIRSALGTQQMPPNQVLIGLALFLTLFVMSPIVEDINKNAWQPYTTEQISQEKALEVAMEPLRDFMIRNTRQKDVALFLTLSGVEKKDISNIEDVPSRVIIPAFVISELKTAFQIGFIIHIPFIVIDMVVASVLMSMGMMMLPPAMISLPFKILLFIMVDGWNMLIGELIKTIK